MGLEFKSRKGAQEATSIICCYLCSRLIIQTFVI